MYTELISDDVKPVKSDLSPAPEEQPTSTSNSETVSLFCACHSMDYMDTNCYFYSTCRLILP